MAADVIIAQETEHLAMVLRQLSCRADFWDIFDNESRDPLSTPQFLTKDDGR